MQEQEYLSRLSQIKSVNWKPGKTVMLMALDHRLAGMLAVADTLKESAPEAVSRSSPWD